MASLSSLGRFVSAYTLKHKTMNFASNAKFKESPWPYVQELFDQQTKTCKKNKKLKSLAMAGMYEACIAMSARNNALEDLVQRSREKIINMERANQNLLNELNTTSTLNEMIRSSHEEQGKIYRSAQGELVKYKQLLVKSETECGQLTSAYKIAQEQIAEIKKGKPIDHTKCKEREAQLIQTITILKGRAAISNQLDQGRNTAPACAEDMSISKAAAISKSNQQMERENKTLPLEKDWMVNKIEGPSISSGKGRVVQPPPANEIGVSCLDNRTVTSSSVCREGHHFNNSIPLYCKKSSKSPGLQPKPVSGVSKCVNAFHKIKCYACGLFGHIARFCLSLGTEKRINQGPFKTYRRDTEVYSPRWGTHPHKHKPGVSLKYSKAQNNSFQAENDQMKTKLNRFLEEFRAFKREYRETMNCRRSGISDQSVGNPPQRVQCY